MSTRADDGHETSSNRDSAAYPSDRGAESVPSPITSPDASASSAPDPDFAPEAGAGDATAHAADGDIAHTRTAALWTGLVIGAVVLVILLVFILQNLDPATVQIFAWQLDLPLGISMLLAAIAGALVMALVGGARILQVRRAAKKN